MIAPDANLLIYAYASWSPFHKQSRLWLERILSSTEPVGIPIHSIYAFLRILTNPKLPGNPTPMRIALAAVDSWLALPSVRVLYPGERHWDLLKSLMDDGQIAGAHVTDAAIAALALEYGAIIHTNDIDFARFPNVRWHNPLKP